MNTPQRHVDTHRIRELVREILIALGEDSRPRRSPEDAAARRRCARLLTSGTRTELEKIINGAIFTQQTNSMVIVKNIEVYSLCEHHMLPFFGRCHIATSDRQSVRRFEARSSRRHVRAPSAIAGAPDRADLASVMESIGAKAWGDDRGRSFVHDDALGVEKQNSKW
jgi:GTP cyclohydrolase I